MAPTRSSFTGFCLLESSTWFPQALIRFTVFYLFIYFTAILLPKTTAHIYLCTFTHPQTFPWFYCRMFTGERLALDPRSGHFRVEPCNYQPIAPAAAFFFALTVFVFLNIGHHLRAVWGDCLQWRVGAVTTRHCSLLCCQANNSLLVYDVIANRSAS